MDGFSISNRNGSLQTGNIEFQRTDLSPIPGRSQVPDQSSFGETLKAAIHEVNRLQQVSDKKMQDLATGKTDNIPDVMIAAEKADIALKLMVQVRSKIIDAYQEIMKMQV